jgi:hypothetical protein
LKNLSYFIFLLFYELLSTIYLVLPPLLGIGFILFIHFIRKQDVKNISLVVIFLLFYDLQRDYIILTSVIFYLFFLFFLPKIEQLFDCRKCLLSFYILLVYSGHWIYMNAIHHIFSKDLISFDWHIFYYAFFEFFLVLLFA